MSEPDPKTWAQRFFAFGLLSLGGVVLLYLAIQLLAQFWGWLLLIFGFMAAIWVTVAVIRGRRNRW